MKRGREGRISLIDPAVGERIAVALRHSNRKMCPIRFARVRNSEASPLTKPVLEFPKPRVPKIRRKSIRSWIWLLLLFSIAALGTATLWTLRHAEPILQARITQTLSARFHGPVELAVLHVSVANGLRVSGGGLRIFSSNDPNPHQPGVQPVISVNEFQFSAGILNLLHTPMRIHRVFLKGLKINVPPKEQRARAGKPGKIKIYVDEFVCENAQLIINTLVPDKLPLDFDIGKLDMREIGPGQPLRFEATLTNPKPVGDIHSLGFFGPWQADDPRSSLVRGQFSFSNADLSTIKGIGGILSSTGDYEGSLGSIAVTGQTSTPDFRITFSGRPVPLDTKFHAIVDGTSGDTYLQPVQAKILNSFLVAKGSVVKVKNPNGHRVMLNVTVDPARIEDLLKLGIRTDPPVMMGKAKLSTKLDLGPGEVDVSNRLKLAGTFLISGAHFANDKIQSKVDVLSMRGQGKPKEAKGDIPDVPSLMSGTYNLSNGLLSFSKLRFQMPGAQINLTGKYSLDGSDFEFHGKARMQAKLSHMLTGWKSVLLKPVDPFFSKPGAGAEIPIKVTGTKSEPHFGLDFGHK